MLDYLSSAGFRRSVDALKQDSNLEDFQPDPKAKWSGLLEKKWTSVIRLQKKVSAEPVINLSRVADMSFALLQIMELESRNAQLQEELSSAPAKRSSASSPDWVPRAPARHTLTGHRSPVTRIAFHPLFNQIVSASEDATLKVWDWESGDFERTVKGHTKPVQDVDFDSKGNFVGKLSNCACPDCDAEIAPRPVSVLFLGSDIEIMGHKQRLEEYQDLIRTRSLDLLCTFSTKR